jgi:hypothetical protein
MVNYVLENNPLTKDKLNDRYARVVNVHSYTQNDLAEAISKRNLGISKAEALAMLEAAAEIQLEWLTAGNAVNLQLEHFHFGIPGSYKENEHPTEVVIRITPSKELAEAAKKITLQQTVAISQLRVDYVDDLKSATTNKFITRGGTVKIFGHNLRIAGANPAVRVEFISVEDPKAIYPVLPVDLIINNPANLLIVAPQMTIDEPVRLKITTQYAGNSGKPLNNPRSTIFEKIFITKG